MKNYSQNKEQDVILKYFGDFVGTFLSIGENDGQTFSNVRALALLGWKGCMIEPSPKAFDRLKKLYEGHEGFYVYQNALGAYNGKVILQESGNLVSRNDVALVSTFVPSEQDRFRSAVTYEPVEVDMLRWESLYELLEIKQFDLLSLDAEGLDLEILKQIDLSNFKCLILEWNGRPELLRDYTKLAKGFKLIYTSGENLIFAR